MSDASGTGLVIQCPYCRSRYRTAQSLAAGASRTVTCPQCREPFQVISDGTGLEVAPLAHVLVVDDARFFRELLQDLLADQQLRLTTADNAGQAWELLTAEDFDLLIVDINLPDLNGLELVSRIRTDRRLAALPILCLSGVYRQEEDSRKALRAGADDFLGKSFAPEELIGRINRLLQR